MAQNDLYIQSNAKWSIIFFEMGHFDADEKLNLGEFKMFFAKNGLFRPSMLVFGKNILKVFLQMAFSIKNANFGGKSF